MMQPGRVEQVRARYLELGEAASLPPAFVAALFETLIDATCAMEDELMGAPRAGTRRRSRTEQTSMSAELHPTFITLGPSGTCHENALTRYLDFQGVEHARIDLLEDLLGAIGRVGKEPNTFLCSAARTPRCTS